MARLEEQEKCTHEAPVDDNNNTSEAEDSSSRDSGGMDASLKYGLRPRSGASRRRCSGDWSFEDRLRHKPRGQPLSRYRRKTANARERYRMRQINSAFESLRGVLPSWVCSRRAASDMTKIATLRLASAYIRSLQDILDGNAPQDTVAWVLSAIIDSPRTKGSPGQEVKHEPQDAQLTIKPQPHEVSPQSEFESLLCGGTDTTFDDTLSFSYYTPMSEPDIGVSLLLGADPGSPTCWSAAMGTQHTSIAT